MPAIKPDQLEQIIRSGKVQSLYLFDGPENWLKERALNQLISKLVPPESKDFNMERLDGNSCSAGDIINAAQGLPFLGDRRLIVVSAAEELAAADSRAVGEILTDLPASIETFNRGGAVRSFLSSRRVSVLPASNTLSRSQLGAAAPAGRSVSFSRRTTE